MELTEGVRAIEGARQRAVAGRSDQEAIKAFSYEVGRVVRDWEGRLTPAGVSGVLFDLACAKMREVRGREYNGEKVN